MKATYQPSREKYAEICASIVVLNTLKGIPEFSRVVGLTQAATVVLERAGRNAGVGGFFTVDGDVDITVDHENGIFEFATGEDTRSAKGLKDGFAELLEKLKALKNQGGNGGDDGDEPVAPNPLANLAAQDA